MYARALPYFAEQNNLQKRDQPHLLAESITELRREVGFYLSFTDEEVFWGVDLLEEEESNTLVTTATDIAATTDIHGATDGPEVPPVPKTAPKYAGWETIIHPSQPVLATWEIPQPTSTPRPKGRALQPARTTSISTRSSLPKAPLLPKSPLPARALALVRLPMPPHGFARVAACLKTLELMEVEWETPVGTMSIGMVMIPSLLSIG